MRYFFREVVDEVAVSELVSASLEDSERLRTAIVDEGIGGFDIASKAKNAVADAIADDAIVHSELGADARLAEDLHREGKSAAYIVATVFKDCPLHDVACAGAIEIDAAPLAWVIFIPEVSAIKPIALEDDSIVLRTIHPAKKTAKHIQTRICMHVDPAAWRNGELGTFID